MSKTLWAAVIAIGAVIGAAGAPPNAEAGTVYARTAVGTAGQGGYLIDVRHDRYHRYDHRGWGRHRYYGHHYHNYHGHHGTGDALLGFMIGALAVGVIASSQNHDRGPDFAYDRPAPPPPGEQGCHIVNRIGPDRTGRTVKFAATMCYDEDGTPYIAPGTQHIIERY